MFKDKLWAAEVGNVFGMHLEGIPISDAYELLADWIEDHPDVQRRMGVALAIKDFTQLRKEREREAQQQADLKTATGWMAQALPGMAEILPTLPRSVEVAPQRHKSLPELRFSDVIKHLNIVDNRAQQMIDGGNEYHKDQHRKWDPILAALPSDDSRTIAEIIDSRPDEEYGTGAQ
jgi:hypothetical protein